MVGRKLSASDRLVDSSRRRSIKRNFTEDRKLRDARGNAGRRPDDHQASGGCGGWRAFAIVDEEVFGALGSIDDGGPGVWGGLEFDAVAEGAGVGALLGVEV